MAKKNEVMTNEPVDAFAYLAALRDGTIELSAVQEFEIMPTSGADLIDKDTELHKLEGVPFFILGFTFRAGYLDTVAGQKVKGDYVSIQLAIAPEEMLAARGVDPADLPWPIMSPLVVNDGSTGMRRSAVKYLVDRNIVTLREDKANHELRQSGKRGEADLDIPVGFWHAMHAGETRFDTEGNTVYSFTPAKPIICARGVRKSEYSNEYGEGTTWYFG